jgi:hypothetical protein
MPLREAALQQWTQFDAIFEAIRPIAIEGGEVLENRLS